MIVEMMFMWREGGDSGYDDVYAERGWLIE